MTEFTVYDAATHPIIKAVDDWNNLLGHGLEKNADYIIRVNGVDYEALKGGTTSDAGTIAFGGADDVGSVDGAIAHLVIEAAHTAANGGHIHLKKGTYTLTDVIDIEKAQTYISGSGIGTSVTQSTADKNCFHIASVTHCRISNMLIYGTGAGTGQGININSNAHRTMVDHCLIENHGNNGIQVYNSNECQITNNKFASIGAGTGANCAIFAQGSNHGVYANNKIRVCYGGITLDGGCNDNLIVGNLSKGNVWDAMSLEDASNDNTVTGNVLTEAGHYGLYIVNSTSNLVTGNIITDSDFADTATYSGVMILSTGGADYSDRNIIVNNIIRDNDLYDIHINHANCRYNHIGYNNMRSSNSTLMFTDNGTATEMKTLTVPFSEGSVIDDNGWEIDGAAEYAQAWLFLPLEVQQVVKIYVYARSLVTEADAMRCDFTIQGGADNENGAAHDGSETNLPSTSTNFTQNDVIYWTLDAAGVTALTGGDSVIVRAIYHIAGGVDSETDAGFRTASVFYV